MKMAVIPIVVGTLENGSQKSGTETEMTGDLRKNQNRPDHNTVEIGWNTEKS